ncbi:Got1p [Ascoidea rubescens DSM 1968]|uniref:Got1-domain-containing protein n=1 Tax=Ascoidea rubescens DSM 1968 TaxID=1344418 RepID=A0A1D2VDT9_9ASCO|nr:Got1-domain-containing protein [Ascoidea rubescens DSM 1968]ODV59796.1 Got1-domain-containing protein [Ascoidea rubescens DSM 1968]
MLWLTETQKFGVGFTALGVVVFFLGVISFFDSALLSFGNILFIIGLPLIIGPLKTVNFFLRPNKLYATICFILGIGSILLKHPFIGFLIESYGILKLFGDFFSVIISFLRNLPIIGNILSHPKIAPFIDRLTGQTILPV